MLNYVKPGEIRKRAVPIPLRDVHRPRLHPDVSLGIFFLRGRIATPLLLLLGGLLLSACATTDLRRQECRSGQAPSLPYSLMSHTERTDNLPDETVIAAHYYRVRPDRVAVKPCSEVALVKDIHLRRATNRPLQLREQREFYAEDGTLVAQSEEYIGMRLSRSGNYRAIQVLPIPAGAPPGRYRIVADLYLEDRDNPPILLNSAQTELRVLAPAVAKAALAPSTKANTRPRTEAQTSAKTTGGWFK